MSPWIFLFVGATLGLFVGALCAARGRPAPPIGLPVIGLGPNRQSPGVLCRLADNRRLSLTWDGMAWRVTTDVDLVGHASETASFTIQNSSGTIMYRVGPVGPSPN